MSDGRRAERDAQRVTGTEAFPRAVDGGLVPLAFDDSRTKSSFRLQPPLLRHDGALYGGTAIAASVIAMETATQREAQWVTTQFVLPGQNGETVELTTDVLASGRRTAQVRVTGTVGDRVIFASLGSTGIRTEKGLTGEFGTMPHCGGPDDADERWFGNTRPVEGPDVTFRRMVEYRAASPMDMGQAGPILLWTRFSDGRPMTPAGVAFVADMVPLAIARGAGKLGGGTSLDNSMRFGEVPEVEWVLLELHGDLAAGGYGHGHVRVWSEEGDYLAVGGQTASMVHLFDEGNTPPFFTRAK